MRDVKIKNPNLEIVEGPHADDPVLAPRDDHVLPVPLVHLALRDAQDLTTLKLKDMTTLDKVWTRLEPFNTLNSPNILHFFGFSAFLWVRVYLI